ncbi:SusD family protein [Gracilimonas mengyeensis]|uniref:SusD family protein n=2 Tax=Gracilimonas mengyeensis TaxID=1302730 RepID=A0A521EYR9_9BACT|nr:SusD family protein [Gracilimonas mengyeensis]
MMIVLAMFMTISCTDQFLDTEPIGKAGIEQFYQSDDDALKAIMATYDVLQWGYARDWNSPYMVKTLPSDEVNAGGSSSGDQPPYQRINDFSFSAENAPITASYQSFYYGVYRANQVINNVDPSASAQREQIVAEAKFLRAWFYFELVSMFGGVPLNLKDLAPSEYSQPRASVADVYAQIEQDLTEAISVLPLKSEYPVVDSFRATKGAAQALLGKAHLYQEEWSEAAVQFDNVISSGEYELVEDFSTVFLEEQEFGSESVFEISYVKDAGYDWGNFPWGTRVQESNIHWQLTGPRVDNYTDGNGTGLRGGWGFLWPTDDMYQAYISEGDSLRRVSSLLNEAELEARGDTMSGSPYQYEGYIRVKYGTIWDETSDENGQVPDLNYGTNIRLIRYADVLLMAAEANYHTGNEAEALRLLNGHNSALLGVRERAGLEPVTSSGTALFEDIKEERRLELAFEGVRYLDLIRWGDAPRVLGPRGFVEGKHELFPIPSDELRRNSAIGENNPRW